MIVSYSMPQETTSPLWAKAFSCGSEGEVSEENILLPGDVALFGSPSRWDLLRQAQQEGRTWYYGDHGYFGRRKYFRTTKNAYQHDGSGAAKSDRFESFGIRVRDWRADGRTVVLCPNSPGFFRLHGLTCDQWIRQTAEEIGRYTDRPITVRFKTDGADLQHALRDAWACVVYSSVSGMYSALSGIPCFATTQCASLSFGSGDLSRIESPVRPANRFEMACVLAENQWTIAEMANGEAWEKLSK